MRMARIEIKLMNGGEGDTPWSWSAHFASGFQRYGSAATLYQAMSEAAQAMQNATSEAYEWCAALHRDQAAFVARVEQRIEPTVTIVTESTTEWQP